MLIYAFLCHVSGVPVWLASDNSSEDYIEPEEVDGVEIICVSNDSIQYFYYWC